MAPGITWYDVLGVLPGAEAEHIRRDCESKARLLRPALLDGAPSTVVTAATRAQGILDAAWRVLGDPAQRVRYDETAGIRSRGGGLAPPASTPSEPGWTSLDFDFVPGNPAAELFGGLMTLADWMGPHAREPRRIIVPDVRGLFYSACLAIIGRLGLYVTPVRLTEHPLPVDGLVVDQSPSPLSKTRRAGTVTVQVWHPPARR